MLQVAVHGQNKFALGMVESRRQRRSLPKIPPQLHHQNPAIDCGNLLQQAARAVIRPVVHKHQLKRIANVFHDLLQPVIQNSDVVFFIMERNDDRVLRHRLQL